MNLARGREGFFRIFLTGVPILEIALISNFFEARIFLSYTGRSLNAGERFLYGENIFAIA
jgi:hypothetical protein